MDENTTTIQGTDDLGSIPGIGPARKATLVAGGVTTRAALAQASVEQLVSLTGMPRAQAEKTLAFLQENHEALPVAPGPLESTEATETTEGAGGLPFPAPALNDSPVLPDDDQDPATAARGMLDRAAFRAKTAISDATRLWNLPKLSKPLARIVLLLDAVVERVSGSLNPKAAKRLAARLEAHADWIERTLAANKPFTEKRRDRIRQRLKSDRSQIAEAIRATIRRSADQKSPAKPIGRELNGRPRRIKGG
ncbi:MAG: hypothetical protein H7Z41_15740 [Cytophagales bacterium]|nr:hypothetical protein [Armatimonadota bacterium]